jgi:hypothetical protein
MAAVSVELNTYWCNKRTGLVVLVRKVYLDSWNHSAYVQVRNLTTDRVSSKRHDLFLREFVQVAGPTS